MRSAIFISALALALCVQPALAQTAIVYIQAGDNLRAKFDNKGALEQYRKALEQNPESVVAQTRLSQALVDNGEDLDSKESEKYYTEAMNVAKQVVEGNPSLGEGHYLLALATGKLALFRGGKEKVRLSREVEQSGVKALGLDPKHSRGHILMGVYYREIANLNWALKMFANTFFGGLPKGTNEDAILELNKALELDPTSIRAWFELGKTHEVMGDDEAAAKEYRSAINLPLTDHLDARFIAESKLGLQRVGE
ncbi:MAG: tetratricopeptide repeat protein [Nitrospinota bacterium]|nr:tetratricopeptide repeat protein [Nitrospinota bacterium]